MARGALWWAFSTQRALVAGDVLGRVEDLARVARAEFVDEVILAIPDQRDVARRVIREARRNRLNIRVIPDLYGCEQAKWAAPPWWLEYFGDLPVLRLHEERSAAAGPVLEARARHYAVCDGPACDCASAGCHRAGDQSRLRPDPCSTGRSEWG